MAISKSNMNKVKGPSLERRRRIQKAKRATSKPASAVTASKNLSRKKQKKVEKALRNEKNYLVSRGLIDQEEEMRDIVEVPREKQRVVVTIPEDILAASLAGPGTTLGSMY
ncbi:unnamed protein product [Absidia cylindrospora]